jgi:hypothetical protein
MRRVSMAALAVALFALPAALAGTVQAHAQADTAATEGVSLLDGRLMVLLQESGAGLPAPAGFHLEAGSVVVETTVRDPSVHAGGLAVGIDPRTTGQEARDATIQGLAARPGDRFDLFALPQHAPPRLHAETGCTSWSASQDDEVVRSPRVPTRSERTARASVASAVEVGDCDGSVPWTVTGDFLVLLWERDITVSDSQGRREVRSGRLPPGGAGGTPSGGGPFSADQEVYLYVSNGTLQVPMDAATRAWLAPEASLAAHGVLRLRHATVGLAGETLRGPEVTLVGDVRATLRTSGRLLDLDVTGSFGVGDAPAADPAASRPAQAPLGPNLMAAAVAGVGALALAAGWALRRPR